MNNGEQPNIVPFGKYKGQPAEVLAADPNYVEWLNGQGWVKDKYPQFYTVIINNFQEPSDTPEHNAIQALFLDDELCIKTLWSVNPIGGNWIFREFISKQFEIDGVDVLLNYKAWSVEKYKKHEAYERENGRETKRHILVEWCTHIFKCAIEVKPSIGDDFPGILRQARRMDANDKCVIFRDFVATSVSLGQVRDMFKASEVHLFSLDEVHDIKLYTSKLTEILEFHYPDKSD